MKAQIAAMALLLAIASPARAEDPEWNCDNPQAQQEMNYCAAEEFDKADAELNATYQKARAYTRKQDKDLADMGPDYQGADAALKKAQRAWIDYRDGHCDGMGFQARGGTLEPLLVATCRTELTKNRTKELNELMSSLED